MSDVLNRTREQRLETVLWMILDAVDYTEGACRPNEMVGAVLPKGIIEIAKNALEDREPPETP